MVASLIGLHGPHVRKPAVAELPNDFDLAVSLFQNTEAKIALGISPSPKSATLKRVQVLTE